MIPTPRQILNRQKRIVNALALIVEETLSWTVDEFESNLPADLIDGMPMRRLESRVNSAEDALKGVKSWIDETLYRMSNPEPT